MTWLVWFIDLFVNSLTLSNCLIRKMLIVPDQLTNIINWTSAFPSTMLLPHTELITRDPAPLTVWSDAGKQLDFYLFAFAFVLAFGFGFEFVVPPSEFMQLIWMRMRLIAAISAVVTYYICIYLQMYLYLEMYYHLYLYLCVIRIRGGVLPLLLLDACLIVNIFRILFMNILPRCDSQETLYKCPLCVLEGGVSMGTNFKLCFCLWVAQ